MIGKIRGTVDSVSSDSVILFAGNVGYLLHCSSKNCNNMQISEEVTLFVETHVREDQITLYGFIDFEEKQCFLKLVTVKGVGPKMALQILSFLSVSEIIASISNKDQSVFLQISGVGPKLVNRIFAELKAKDFANVDIANVSINGDANISPKTPSSLESDAVSALVNLGINKSDASFTVAKIAKEQDSIDLNNLIKISLNSLSKRVT